MGSRGEAGTDGPPGPPGIRGPSGPPGSPGYCQQEYYIGGSGEGSGELGETLLPNWNGLTLPARTNISVTGDKGQKVKQSCCRARHNIAPIGRVIYVVS